MRKCEDRSKRYNMAPEPLRAKRLREHGFTKMAEEHERIARAIEHRRQRSGRNNARLVRGAIEASVLAVAIVKNDNFFTEGGTVKVIEIIRTP
jgi:hypothetical protein